MTKRAAVVGHPIAHSLSPLLHNAIYAREHIDAEMRAYDAPEIEPFVEKIRKEPLHLVAVTLPHKKAIMPFLEKIDPIAQEIGAVNTVINREGTLVGYNTDVVGIAASLKDMKLSGINVLILGAGGAARPVAYYLKQQGAIMFCQNRTFDAAEALCRHFGGTPLRDVAEASAVSFDLVINATSLGLRPGDPSPFPAERIRRDMVLFDFLYTPTKFLKEGAAQGARTISGLGMFVAQGLEQEKLWLGREILDSGYTALLRGALNSQTV